MPRIGSTVGSLRIGRKLTEAGREKERNRLADNRAANREEVRYRDITSEVMTSAVLLGDRTGNREPTKGRRRIMRVASISGIVRTKSASGKRGRTKEQYDAALYTIGEGQAVDLTEDIATILSVEVEEVEGFENSDEVNPVDTLAAMMDENQTKKVAALVTKTRTRIAETLGHKNEAGKLTQTMTTGLIAYDGETEEGETVTRFGIVLS